MTMAPTAVEATGRNVVAWHGLTVDEACKGLGIEPRRGLSPGPIVFLAVVELAKLVERRSGEGGSEPAPVGT